MHYIRNRFGIPGVISVIALVFAMLGGAYAASNSSGGGKATASAKAKKGPRGPKGATGPAGPAGPAGPQGAKGDKGDAGAKGDTGAAGQNGAQGNPGTPGTPGSNGAPGAPGESVEVVELAAENGSGHCEDGGAVFSNETGTAYACNGEDGEGGGGGYPDTLPSGKTMTGYWSVGNGTDTFFGMALVTLSYPLPLASTPTSTVKITSSSTEPEKVKCPGSSSEPKAAPGILCLYPELDESTLVNSEATKYGAILAFEEGSEAFGSWAVKAP